MNNHILDAHLFVSALTLAIEKTMKELQFFAGWTFVTFVCFAYIAPKVFICAGTCAQMICWGFYLVFASFGLIVFFCMLCQSVQRYIFFKSLEC